MNQPFLMVLFILNLISFALFGIDKAKAKMNAWRISEKVLLTWSLIGGVGGFIGMEFFRHKTRKPQFRVATIAGVFLTLFVLLLM